MGSILAVFGEPGDPRLRVQLDRMVARSPHRGKAVCRHLNGYSVGVQSLGRDASLCVRENTVVAFHGFVGNWSELSKTHRLDLPVSASHAEMVAVALEEIGEQVFGLLRGEFAVLIHNIARSEVVAVRDVVGCRPFFFQESGDRVFLASEIRQIVAGTGRQAELNDRALVARMARLPQIDDETLFSNIRYVTPGSINRFGMSGSTERRLCCRVPFWDFNHGDCAAFRSPNDWLEEFAYRLKRSVQRWLPSHPSGIALSGGLDSSAVWSQVVELASQGFKPARAACPFWLHFPGYPCDERKYIEMTLAQTGHEGVEIDGTQESEISLRPKLLECLDTVPYFSMFLVFMLADSASKHGKSTVLTGVLGDHWFDVRPISTRARLAGITCAVLPRFLSRSLLATFSRLRRSRAVERFGDVGDWVGKRWRPFVEERRWEAFIDRLDWKSPQERALDRERTGWVFQSWDQIGASVQVEFRHPFSDPDIISIAHLMPESLSYEGLTKPALRRLLASELPAEVTQRTQSTVFDSLWINKSTGASTLATKTPPGDWYVVNHEIVDPHALDSMISAIDTNVGVQKTVLRIEMVESFVQTVLQTGKLGVSSEQQ